MNEVAWKNIRIGIRSAARLITTKVAAQRDRGGDDAGHHRVTLDGFGRAVGERLEEHDRLRALAHHGEKRGQPERDAGKLLRSASSSLCEMNFIQRSDWPFEVIHELT